MKLLPRVLVGAQSFFGSLKIHGREYPILVVGEMTSIQMGGVESGVSFIAHEGETVYIESGYLVDGVIHLAENALIRHMLNGNFFINQCQSRS